MAINSFKSSVDKGVDFHPVFIPFSVWMMKTALATVYELIVGWIVPVIDCLSDNCLIDSTGGWNTLPLTILGAG